jgi:uncharacterized protein YjiS (DUF1127 family)
MDETLHVLRFHRRDDVGGAVRIASLEGGAVRRIDHAGDVQDSACAAYQLLKLAMIVECTEHPFDAFARWLRPARERTDLDSLSQRFREHGLADEAGRTGDCDGSQSSTI